MRFAAVFVVIAVLLSGCNLLGGGQPAEGVLDLTVESVLSEVSLVTAILTQGDLLVKQDLEIDRANASATGTVSALSDGTWIVRIETKDSLGEIIDNAYGSIRIESKRTVSMMIDLAQSPVSKIAFVSDRNGSSDIFIMNANGENPINLTQGRFREVGAPALSPDGTKIVFVADNDVFIMNSDGSDPINITEGNPPLASGAEEAMRSSPTWSPNGEKIAFSTNHPGTEPRTTEALLYVMDADGQNQFVLFDNEGSTSAIIDSTWSGDGSKIAFARSGHLYALNADDGSDRAIMISRDRDGRIRTPAWSPDGTKIAYRVDTSKDIFVMNLANGSVKNLTNDDHDNTSPTWSPDGTMLAYVSMRNGNTGIYVINVVESDATPFKLSSGNVNDQDPSWR